MLLVTSLWGYGCIAAIDDNSADDDDAEWDYDEWHAGTATLTFSGSVPWQGTDHVIELVDDGSNQPIDIKCTAGIDPEPGYGGELNLRVGTTEPAGVLQSFSLHMRDSWFFGNGTWHFWHGDDYGFIEINAPDATGALWKVPWDDPEQKTCEGQYYDGGARGDWTCLDLPMYDANSDEGDDVLSRVDLRFEWDCS